MLVPVTLSLEHVRMYLCVIGYMHTDVYSFIHMDVLYGGVL